jgi:DNA-binding NarL/FixJ family response regulator
MSEQEEKEILKELQRISRLLVIIAIKDQTQLQEKIAVLSKVGFENKDIADFCGTSPNAVRAALSNIRRKVQNKKEEVETETEEIT